MIEPLYYAQNREDQWIAENLPLPEKGFYVDIGAGHPFTTSNTAFLRDRKWEGLAIDGNLAWAPEWDGIPAFHSAVISSQPSVSFYESQDNPYWSRICENGQWREAETIEQLLERFGIFKFDFLSVDTEGTEFEILQMFDFEKHDPQIVVAEYNAAHLPIVEPEDSPIPPFMRKQGYRLRHAFHPVNMIFTRE